MTAHIEGGENEESSPEHYYTPGSHWSLYNSIWCKLVEWMDLSDKADFRSKGYGVRTCPDIRAEISDKVLTCGVLSRNKAIIDSMNDPRSGSKTLQSEAPYGDRA